MITNSTKTFLICSLVFFLGCKSTSFVNKNTNISKENVLFYNEPAKNWLEALPLGNGRLGAMVFANPKKERIQLNENSLWPDENGWGLADGNPEDLKKVRELLLKGENKAADELFVSRFLTKDIVRSHQTMGDLWIDFNDAEYSNYKRSLDIENAITHAEYNIGTSKVSQEVIVSHPDEVLVIRYKTDSNNGLNATISMDRPKDQGHETSSTFVEGNSLIMQGEITQYDGVFKGNKDPITSGVKFDTRLTIKNIGGEVTYAGNIVKLKNVKEATIYLVASTSYYHEDYITESQKQLAKVSRKDFETINTKHVKDYHSLYNKMQLAIEHEPSKLPTNERLEQVKEGKTDVGLEELLFNYGRYLLISSSRKGTLPANLQGLWNDKINAPWNADYHVNINLQMNYWLANVTNLDEVNLALFDFIDRLVQNGKTAAKENYGCEGSFIAHATDIWGTSFLRSSTAYWGASFGAGGWLMQHYWNHYLFAQDKSFLKNRAFPAMQEVAKFYSDWIIEDPKTGKLISAPSSSPENSFINENGDTAALCLGSAKDQQVIYELFSNYLKAAKILNIETDWTNTIRTKLKKLRSGIQVGSDGRIMEWDREYKEPEPGHRHMSHLYAFHPGNQITVNGTPELVKAVRKSLDYRVANGGGHTGWSRAWLINLEARLLDGEGAYKHIQKLLQKSMNPNLFDMHPPFQIDGNFGYTAGIAEMLIQSHEPGLIRILPALPQAWKTGSVVGLKARGNISANIYWQNQQPTKLELTSPVAQTVSLKFGDEIKTVKLQRNKQYTITDFLRKGR